MGVIIMPKANNVEEPMNPLRKFKLKTELTGKVEKLGEFGITHNDLADRGRVKLDNFMEYEGEKYIIDFELGTCNAKSLQIKDELDTFKCANIGGKRFSHLDSGMGRTQIEGRVHSARTPPPGMMSMAGSESVHQ